MSELKVSPLLDAMEIGECFAKHDGVCCYSIRHPESGREFVLKHISVPPTQDQVQALLLTGAYTSEEQAAEYYRREAEDLLREVEERKKLLDCPYILPFLGVQMEQKTEGVGYDVYVVLPKRNSLQGYLSENTISHLRGINMGIDICEALAALREEGYIFGNLRPGNVFFSDSGRFLLGDFGLLPMEDMQYGVLPEQYRSSYTAPELRNFIGGLNTTVDIYALGMILYRIYNGNHAPFEDEKTPARAADLRRLEGEALPAPLYADYELTEIIQKACAYDPAKRYQNPDEMRFDLEQYMRRNAVSDHLIVPPLVTDGESVTPESPEPEDPETEPGHFAAPETGEAAGKQGKKKKKRRKGDQDPAPAPEKPAVETAPAQPEQPAEQKSKAPERAPVALPEDPDERPVKEETPSARRREPTKKEKRRKKAWITFALLMLLVVAFIGVWEFTGVGKGMYHFLARAELEVSDVTADSLRLHLDSNISEKSFTAHCRDTYGNTFTAPFRDGVAEFTGLNPGTQYQLEVQVSGLHRLTGPAAVSAATRPETELLTFTAADGAEQGAVQLSLVVRDGNTEPEEWTLAYGPTGADKEIQTTFTGHSCLLTGLEGGTEYSFRLVESDDLYLSGQTELVFTPQREILAEGLMVDDIFDGTAYISWRCSTEPPTEWVLSCRNEAEQEMEITVNPDKMDESTYYCSATVLGIQPGDSYTLRVTAPGLYQPLSLKFNGTYIKTTELQLESIHGGEARLSWRCLSDLPEQWLLACADSADHSVETEVLPDAAEESGYACAAVLRGLQPGVHYSVELFAAGMEEVRTLEFDAPFIQAAELQLDGLHEDHTATLSWSCDTEDHEPWQLSCRDAEGRMPEVEINPDKLNENSFYCSATLRNLRPGTVYTVELFTEGMEAPATLEFHTEYVAVEGPVLESLSGPQATLSWTCSSPDHGPWQLTVKDAEGRELPVELGEETETETGIACTAVVSGLTAGMNCTAELFAEGLEAPAALEFHIPGLQVTELTVDSLEDGVARLSWSCDTESHEPWQLTCTAEDGTELEAEVNPDVLNENSYYCSATIRGIQADTAYTVSLFTAGMDEPMTLPLRRGAPITVSDFRAEAGAEGVTITWNADGAPVGGWRIRKACGDAETEVTVSGSGCLVAVLPETEYTFTLAAVDDSELIGEHSASLRTPYASRFSGLGVPGENTTIGTYYTPNKENWTDRDLGSGTVTYRSDDRITFQITVGGTPEDTEQTVTTQCVVRDAEDRIVHVTEEEAAWNSLWEGRKWTAPVPWLPTEPGSYSFSVYINGRRLGTINFRLVD